MNNRIFFDWVSPKLDVPLLVILSLCLGVSSGVSIAVSSYMVSGLSTSNADAAMCTYAYFAGMAVGFTLINAMNTYFKSKILLVAICVLLIFFNFILTKTDEAPLIILVTFFIGVVRMMGAIIMLTSFMPLLMPKGERYKLYCVYFPLTLLVSPVSGFAMAWLSDRFNWHFSFHFCNLLLLLALLIVVVCVHDHRKKHSIPLWKFDWFSHVLISAWTLSFIYFLAYGRYKDWFDSKEIRWSLYIAVVCLVWLMIRNTTARKPLMDFKIFRERNIRVGLVLTFVCGAFFTMTNSLNMWMTVAFKKNYVENAYVNLAPCVGYFIGTAICYFYFKNYRNFKFMLILTVAFYTMSFVLMYPLVDANVSQAQLFFPLVLRGIGIVLSYITLGLYITAEVPQEYLQSIPPILIFVRTFFGPAVWGNLYSIWLYSTQIKLLNKLASWTNSDAVGALVNAQYHTKGITNSSVAAYQSYMQQAVLGSIKELFGWVILMGCGLMFFLFFFPIYKKVDRKVFNWTKSKNTADIAATVAA